MKRARSASPQRTHSSYSHARARSVSPPTRPARKLPPPAYFHTVLGSIVERVKKFKVNGYTTKFVLRNLTDQGFPQEALESVLQHLIDDALRRSTEAGYSTNQIGVSFSNSLMHSDFIIPFGPPEQNNAAAIANELMNFDQSENSPNLWHGIVNLKITTVNVPHGSGKIFILDYNNVFRAQNHQF